MASEQRLPIPNSMLTWLLKDSIGGNSKTVMLAAISPVAAAYQETMSTLRYVERAKEIVNAVVVNEDIDNPLIGKLREEVRGLQELLERKEAAIVEHEEREVALEAALERANVDDVSKALCTQSLPDDLESTFDAERREHVVSTIEAGGAAAKAEQCYRQEIDENAEAHADALNELAKRYDENLRRITEEAEEILAEEIAQRKDKAEEAERNRRLYRELEAVAESERARLMDEHKRVMDTAEKDHEDQMERARAKVAEATARASAVEVRISSMRDDHLAEIAAKDTRLAAEVRNLKEEHEKQKSVLEDKAREKQRSIEAELAKKVAEEVENAIAISDAARAKELSNIKAEHDTILLRLSEAQTGVVEAAVAKASERLRLDHEKALAAVEDAHHDESKRWAGELSGKITIVRASLSAEHDEIVKKLSEEKTREIEKVIADAEARRVTDLAIAAEEAAAAIAAERDNSKKALDALRLGNDESLRANDEAHQAEIEHAVEVEKLCGQAELEAAKAQFESDIQTMREEMTAKQTNIEQTHRDRIEEMRKKHEAEISDVLIKAEHNEKVAQDAAKEWEKTSEAGRTVAISRVVSLEAELEKAEKQLQEAQQMVRTLEEQRVEDVEAAERRTSSSISELKTEAAATLAVAEDRHKEEIARLTDMVETLQKKNELEASERYAAQEAANARAMSEMRTEHLKVIADAEAQRVTDLAVAAEEAAAAIAAERDNSENALDALRLENNESLRANDEAYQAEIEHAVEVEKLRGQTELEAAKAQFESDIQTMREEMTAKHTYIEQTHRDRIEEMREKMEAEIGDVLIKAEQKEKVAQDAAKEWEKASEAERTVAISEVASLGAELEKAEKRLQEAQQMVRTLEEQRVKDVEAAERRTSSSMSELKTQAAATLAAAEDRHKEEITRLTDIVETLRKKNEVDATEAKDALSSSISTMEKEKAATVASLEAQHRTDVQTLQDELVAERERALEAAESRRIYELEVLRKDCEISLAQDKERVTTMISSLQEKHRVQLARLEREKDELEERGVVHDAEAESRCSASVEAIWNEAAEETATLVAKHQMELRQVKEEEATQLERISAEAAERYAAQEAANARAMSEMRTEHLKVIADAEAQRVTDLAVAAEEAATAIAAERDNSEKALDALRLENDESLRTHDEAYQAEIEHAVEVEKLRGQTELEAAKAQFESDIQTMREEMTAKHTYIEQTHRDRIEEMREKHEAEISNVLIKAEQKEKVAQDAAKEWGKASEAERTVAISEVASLGAELEKAEKQLQEAQQKVRALEKQRVKDVEAAERRTSSSMSELKTQAAATLAAAEDRHKEEITRLTDIVETLRKKNEVDATEAKDALSSSISTMEKEKAATVASLEAQHRTDVQTLQDKLVAERERALEAAESRRICDLGVLRKDCEISLAQEKERATAMISSLQEKHRAQLARLEREKDELEERGVVHVAEAESRCSASVEAIREEAVEERATLLAKHQMELRQVKEEEAKQLERISAEAAERYAAQEAANARATSEVRTKHLRAVQAMMMEREEAGVAAEVEAQKMRRAFEKLQERHQRELQQLATERDTANARAFAEALADAEASSAQTLAAAMKTMEVEYATELQRERESHAEFIAKVKAAQTASETEAKALVETLKEEKQNAIHALEEAHRISLGELEDARRQEIEKMERKVDTAETEMAEAKSASAELATRASALEEMLQTSEGSREEELVGHRSRVVQLQAFVARRGSLAEGGSFNTTEHGEAVSVSSMQQRVVDLCAIAAGAGVRGQSVGDHNNISFTAFAGSLRAEGLTMERYAEELEMVLIKATVEAIAARQSYLEAEMEHQSVLRQLVGLKLVHAQVRECLEDTRAKLEHKSQSAIRRLLNSATRLAHEFAKPDRFSSLSPRARTSKPSSPSRVPRQACSRHGSGERSPSRRAK